jgi:Transglycosylase SLT domain
MAQWRGTVVTAAVAALFSMSGAAYAAQCGNNGGGYEAWKAEFSGEAKANGIGAKGLKALAATSYSTKTINADRNQKSFKLSLDQFMAKRGGRAIASRGKSLKAANAGLFANLEKRYGVPAGPLIAIWGMETGFGASLGNQNTVSAVATLAYDCRRSAFFTEQLYAALKLVDRGVISGSSIGAMHGEVGQTQFLPKNVLAYGADGDGDGRILGLDGQVPCRSWLVAWGWLSARRAEFRGATGLERGWRLPKGHCHHRCADRRLIIRQLALKGRSDPAFFMGRTPRSCRRLWPERFRRPSRLRS